MVSKGQLVRCAVCGKDFNLPKHAEDADVVKCRYCGSELEVIKKRRHLDVKPLKILVEEVEIEGAMDWGNED